MTVILSVGLYGCETMPLTQRGTQAEDVREKGAEGDIWVQELRGNREVENTT